MKELTTGDCKDRSSAHQQQKYIVNHFLKYPTLDLAKHFLLLQKDMNKDLARVWLHARCPVAKNLYQR